MNVSFSHKLLIKLSNFNLTVVVMLLVVVFMGEVVAIVGRGGSSGEVVAIVGRGGSSGEVVVLALVQYYTGFC